MESMGWGLRQEVAFLVFTVLGWFSMVVPRYALSLQLRSILETKTKAEKLASWSGRVFEANCLLFAALTGLVAGLFTNELSLIWFLVASIGGMVLIGFVSLLTAHSAGVSEEILGRPRAALTFMFAGSTIFWATAAVARWSVFAEQRPDVSEALDLAAAAGVVLSLVSTAWSLWEKVVRKKTP